MEQHQHKYIPAHPRAAAKDPLSFSGRVDSILNRHGRELARTYVHAELKDIYKRYRDEDNSQGKVVAQLATFSEFLENTLLSPPLLASGGSKLPTTIIRQFKKALDSGISNIRSVTASAHRAEPELLERNRIMKSSHGPEPRRRRRERRIRGQSGLEFQPLHKSNRLELDIKLVNFAGNISSFLSDIEEEVLAEDEHECKTDIDRNRTPIWLHKSHGKCSSWASTARMQDMEECVSDAPLSQRRFGKLFSLRKEDCTRHTGGVRLEPVSQFSGHAAPVRDSDHILPPIEMFYRPVGSMVMNCYDDNFSSRLHTGAVL